MSEGIDRAWLRLRTIFGFRVSPSLGSTESAVCSPAEGEATASEMFAACTSPV